MTDNIEALLVFTTVPDEILAVKITESLLQQRLSACVHQMPAGRSTYRWNGTIETAAELTLIIKTTSRCYGAVEALIRSLHTYELPEIIAIPVIGGFSDYLKWIDDETQ